MEIDRCQLDLSGSVVITEAATGSYVVTPVIAAMAGAKHVYAFTKSTTHGTVDTVIQQTMALAEIAHVKGKIDIVTEKEKEIIARADIITNSAHLRPIDSIMIQWMKPTAVISLMYEAWEFRESDLDLDSCKIKNIIVGATNERHASIDVFSYLGIMAIKLLTDAGIAVYGSHILLLCDNNFESYISKSLINAGAKLDVKEKLYAKNNSYLNYDAILVALKPRDNFIFAESDINFIAEKLTTTIIIQFWGDIQREEMRKRNILFWPISNVEKGHMGILPSNIGPEPIIKLQTGGLKVGELLWRYRKSGETVNEIIKRLEASGYGEGL
ncbi:MAG: hypothetical protein NTV01_14725 [Bacteroidia bacterium]|nr:hypothetical protein [Bacteroidia bacterium]